MKLIFSLSAFLLISLLSSQTTTPTNSIIQAKYQDGNLQKVLQNSTTYPIEGIKNNIDGDVIVSFK